MRTLTGRGNRGKPRLWLRVPAVLALAASTLVFTTQLRADEKKVDPWCKVVAGQLKRNDEEARKPHDSAGTERLREERRRIQEDWRNRNCDGH